MSANPQMVEGMADPAAAQEEQFRKREMAEENLLTAISEREASAVGADTDAVSLDRARAIQFYLGEPFGNEIEGRSQVVSKDLFDTVEWIKPSLLRIFAGGNTVAQFSPQGEDDEEGAKQESDYVDYVIQRKNPWFMIAHEWFTDALLTKNAYAMGYWQEQEEAALERYRGLTTDQLTLIAMDRTVQIISHRSYQAPAPIPAPMALQAIASGMLQAFPQVVMHDVDVRRVKSYGCAKICVLPPERCLVAGDAKGMSVRESGFFEYWEYKTISQLRMDGFNIPDDIADTGGFERGTIDEVRDMNTQTVITNDTSNVDPTMRKVKARMVWIRNDFDGDGIAELRYVVAVGSNILENSEVASIPVASIVPYPMPHRHIGLSMFDVMADLQIIKSAMLRAGIDNQYLANNGRTAVDKNRVNLDDMAVSRPGGQVRVDGPPGDAILPFVHPNTVAGTINFIEYLDGLRQDRGGVSKPYAGADLDSIKAQPGTIAQLTSAASQKIELIARIFGEGVKELFSIVHEVTLSNATVPDKVQLRGKWATVDPRTWKKRADMTLSVGLGVGNRQQQVVALQSLLSLQSNAIQVGLCSPPKMYNALSEYVKALGFASGEQFFDEPPPGQQFQAPTPPQVIVAQIKAQADEMVQWMKNNAAATTQQMEDQAAGLRLMFEKDMEMRDAREERMVRMISEQTDRMQEMRLENQRSAAEGRGKLQVVGMDKLEQSLTSAAKAATEAATLAGTHAKAAGEHAAKLKETMDKRPKRREVTAPSGKKYVVEDK